MSQVLESTHDFQLALRSGLRHDLVDTDLPGDEVGRGLNIPGDHDGTHAPTMQTLDGFGGVGARPVGDAEQRRRFAIQHANDRCLAGLGQGSGLFLEGCQPDLQGFHPGQVADDEFAAIDSRLQTLPGHGFEGRGFRQRATEGAGMLDQRLAEKMLGTHLGGAHQGHHRLIAQVGDVDEIGHEGLALGDGSGLVEDDGIDVRRRFQAFAVADIDAALSRLAGADHDRGRRRQTERARAGNQQNGDAGRERRGEAGAGQQPAGEGQTADGHDAGHEHGGDPVDGLLDRQLGGLGLIDHVDDAGQHRIGADGGDPHLQGAGAVDAAADHVVACCLDHGQALPGEHGLVNGGQALDDDAIGRDFLAGPDQDQVADDQIVDRHGDDLAVAQQVGGLRLQVEQPPDGGMRLALGLFLQIAAQQDETDDARGRVEIEVGATEEQGGGAVDIGRADAEHDQAVHVGRTLPGQLERLCEEGFARPEHDGRAKHELRPAPEGALPVGHGNDGHRDAQHAGDDGALPGLPQPLLLALHEQLALRHGVERQSLVAQAFHGGIDLVLRDVTEHRAAFRGHVDRGPAHARVASQHQFDQERAGRAADAFHRELDLLFLSAARQLIRAGWLGPGLAQVGNHGIQQGAEIGLGQLRRIVMHHQAAKAGNGPHGPNGRPLAQKDFQRVQTFRVVAQARRRNAQPPPEAVLDPEVARNRFGVGGHAGHSLRVGASGCLGQPGLNGEVDQVDGGGPLIPVGPGSGQPFRDDVMPVQLDQVQHQQIIHEFLDPPRLMADGGTGRAQRAPDQDVHGREGFTRLLQFFRQPEPQSLCRGDAGDREFASPRARHQLPRRRASRGLGQRPDQRMEPASHIGEAANGIEIADGQFAGPRLQVDPVDAFLGGEAIDQGGSRVRLAEFRRNIESQVAIGLVTQQNVLGNRHE